MNSAKIKRARRASYCSTFIECLCPLTDGTLSIIGWGTGFFYRKHGRVWLVTNWHVATGRHPEKPSMLLPGYPQSPTHIRLCMPSAANLLHFLPGHDISLYEDGRPIWLEHSLGEAVDLVAIPMAFDSDVYLVCVQDFATKESRSLEPGLDVAVVGFPFARQNGNPFPIWKRAMIASEPNHPIGGRMMGYLDTPGRSGMSGSPVYVTSGGFDIQRVAGEDTELDLLAVDPAAMQPAVVLSFAGVYSGSYGDQQLDALNLGRYWPAPTLDLLLADLKPGANPFPPE